MPGLTSPGLCDRAWHVHEDPFEFVRVGAHFVPAKTFVYVNGAHVLNDSLVFLKFAFGNQLVALRSFTDSLLKTTQPVNHSTYCSCFDTVLI